MADSTVEYDMSQDKPVPFTSKLSDANGLKIIRELELVDQQGVEALLRGLDDYALLSEILELIRERKGVNPKPALCANEYRVIVRYEPVPSLVELRKLFNWVSDLYDGRPFEDHPSCRDIDRSPKEVDFLLRSFDEDWEIEPEIAKELPLGYRPPIREETLAFAAAHPDLQRQFWIVAPGSSAAHGVPRYVPVLCGHEDDRGLDYRWVDSWCDAVDRLLLVRK